MITKTDNPSVFFSVWLCGKRLFSIIYKNSIIIGTKDPVYGERMIYMKNTRISIIALCSCLLMSGCGASHNSMIAKDDVSGTSETTTVVTTAKNSVGTTVPETTVNTSTASSVISPESTMLPVSDETINDIETSGKEYTTDETWYYKWFDVEDTILNIDINDTTTEPFDTDEVLSRPPVGKSEAEVTTADTGSTNSTKAIEATTQFQTTTTSPIADTSDIQPDFIDDYSRKYYYNMLSDTQKEYYKYCFNEERYLTNAPEPQYSEKDKEVALFALDRDNPHLRLYPSQYLIDNELTNMTPKKRSKILKIAQSITDKADKYDRTFDKVKILHDELLNHISYEYYHEMEAAFLDGKADCSGYADAFCIVCQLAGIDCIVVYGTANNGQTNSDHAWNMVKLGDTWYNVDVCWDDVNHDNYTYFLKSDNAFKDDHIVDMPISCPKANKGYPIDYLGNEIAG
jgi:transglutaminase/protease-like cytokinesis protein 3